MSRLKEIKDLIREIERAGGVVTMTKGGHWKVVNPTTRQCLRMPATPSDHRSLLNIRSRLRKIGLPLRTAQSVPQKHDPCR